MVELSVGGQKIECPNCEYKIPVHESFGVSSDDSVLFVCPVCKYAELVETGDVTNKGDESKHAKH